MPGSAGTPSIHDREHEAHFTRLPPFDAGLRTLSAVRVVSQALTPEAWQQRAFEPVHDWARARADVCTPATTPYAPDGESLTLELRFDGPGSLEQTLEFTARGEVELRYAWDPAAFPPQAWFAVELSLAREVPLHFDEAPGAAHDAAHDVGPGAASGAGPSAIWRYDIGTEARSERGIERVVQGVSLTPVWPVAAGRCALRFALPVGLVVEQSPEHHADDADDDAADERRPEAGDRESRRQP